MTIRVLTSVRVPVHPTEDSKKVEKALDNVLAISSARSENVSPESHLLVAEMTGLDVLVRLKNLIRQDGIRDAARAELMSSISNGKLRFFLNKQVAFVGHVSFSKETGESPLGPIEVEISTADPIAIVDWLAPGSRS
ncbi:MAG: RNA-binding domain-containing protein [archaeon]